VSAISGTAFIKKRAAVLLRFAAFVRRNNSSHLPPKPASAAVGLRAVFPCARNRRSRGLKPEGCGSPFLLIE
jgi:hypothetical protein